MIILYFKMCKSLIVHMYPNFNINERQRDTGREQESTFIPNMGPVALTKPTD